jgi:hypothetical protein
MHLADGLVPRPGVVAGVGPQRCKCSQAPPLLLVDSMLLDSYGVGNGARETGEGVSGRRMSCLSLKSYCALSIFFQLAVESGLTDAEQLRRHQLVPV